MEPVEQPPIGRGSRVTKSKLPGTRGKFDGSVAPFPREKFLEFCSVLQIQSRDFGVISLGANMLGSQTYVLDEICKGLAEGVTVFVILKDRQSGMSTLFLALDLFWAFEHAGLLGVFATHEEASRDQFRAQIDLFLATLPKRYRIGDNTNNRTMLVLKNTSLFRYLVAGQRSTTNKLGRSGGTNYAHLTEVAFWGSEDDLKSLMQTFSSIYPHRFYAIESTANGYNFFEEMCQTAMQSPSQRFIFSGWWRDERKEFGETHPNYKFYMAAGTASQLSKRERDGIAAVKAAYGFDITAGQIAWYRWHMENNCGGDQATMDQEQPWVPEDAFVATGSKFFVNEALTRQFKAARTALCMPFLVKVTQHWQEIEVRPTSAIKQSNLKIWQEPSRFGRYTLGADVAWGSSPDADNSVISVWRVWADRAEQVAEYSSPEPSTRQFAWVLCYLAGLYKDCMVNIEITGGSGVSVMQEVDRLKEDMHLMTGPNGPDLRNCLARMKDFLYRRHDSLAGNLVRQWKTTPGDTGTKPVLMNNFKNRVEIDAAACRSLLLIEEMRRIRVDGGSIEADTGKDDRVIAAALAVYAWSEWRLPELRSKGLTWERSQTIEKQGGEQAADGLVRRFMQIKKIEIKDRADA